MSFCPIFSELPRHLHLGAVHPDVQGVLLQHHPVHRALHRQDPGLHYLPLSLYELLERFPPHLQIFNININDYLTPDPSILGQMLPQTPDVNPALMSQVLPSTNVMETGLTSTEQALLSPEEQAIRLRQRGMA